MDWYDGSALQGIGQGFGFQSGAAEWLLGLIVPPCVVVTIACAWSRLRRGGSAAARHNVWLAALVVPMVAIPILRLSTGTGLDRVRPMTMAAESFGFTKSGSETSNSSANQGSSGARSLSGAAGGARFARNSQNTGPNLVDEDLIRGQVILESRASGMAPDVSDHRGLMPGKAERSSGSGESGGVASGFPERRFDLQTGTVISQAIIGLGFLGWIAGAVLVLAMAMTERFALSRTVARATEVVDRSTLRRFRQLVGELGIKRHVALKWHDEVAMPMTCGVIRPVILLPAEQVEWSTKRQKMVFLHELAHVKRLDPLGQLLVVFAVAVHWFHPLVWLAVRKLDEERERACDDAVLLTGVRASSYAGELLEIGSGGRRDVRLRCAGMMMARPDRLRRRVEAIVDSSQCREPIRPLRSSLAIALLSALVLPLAILASPRVASVSAANPGREPAAEAVVNGSDSVDTGEGDTDEGDGDPRDVDEEITRGQGATSGEDQKESATASEDDGSSVAAAGAPAADAPPALDDALREEDSAEDTSDAERIALARQTAERRLRALPSRVDSFRFVRAKYATRGARRAGGWMTDFPGADLGLARRLKAMLPIEVHEEGVVLELTDERLSAHPFVYLVEPGSLVLSDTEVVSLRRYLLGGGFLFFDDFWGEEEWGNVKSEMRRVLPDLTPVDLQLSHPIFSIAYDITKREQVASIHAAMMGKAQGVTWERPGTEEVHYWGWLDRGGRLVALACQNTDLGDGWERAEDDAWYGREFSEKRAFPIGVNAVAFAISQRGPDKAEASDPVGERQQAARHLLGDGVRVELLEERNKDESGESPEAGRESRADRSRLQVIFPDEVTIDLDEAQQSTNESPGYASNELFKRIAGRKVLVKDDDDAIDLVRNFHRLVYGAGFVEQKSYGVVSHPGEWVVTTHHDFKKFPSSVLQQRPIEIAVDARGRIELVRHRSHQYLGTGEVYQATVTRVYEREVKVRGGIHHPEVLSEELRIAAAKERGEALLHSSLKHYPDAVLEVSDAKTGQSYYVESNGSAIFARDRDGATEYVIRPFSALRGQEIVGVPVIRHLRLDGARLWATMGKHTEIEIDRKAGRVVGVGSD